MKFDTFKKDINILNISLPVESWAVWWTLLFYLYGSFVSLAPRLCYENRFIAPCSIIFFIIALTRLVYGIVSKKLKPADYALWVGGFIIFRFLAFNIFLFI